jgi:hypothetical protein
MFQKRVAFAMSREKPTLGFAFPDKNKRSYDDIPTHHLLVFEVDLHATAEGFEFTGYGHVGNSLEKLS